MPIRNVLLDRDGTLIVDKHYLSKAEDVELLPLVADSLGQCQKLGLRLFVVSNQSGVGRGYFSHEDVEKCNQRLEELFLRNNVVFTDIIYCPHSPEDHCLCRKPAGGMWNVLQKKYQLRAEETVMVGDKVEDILFAQEAKLAAAFLVKTGKGQKIIDHYEIDIPDRKFFTAPFAPNIPFTILEPFSCLAEVLIDLDQKGIVTICV